MICNADKLKKFISDVMKSAGLPEMDSKNFAESLINADMRGISSHGTTRMKTYYKRLIHSGHNCPLFPPVHRKSFCILPVSGVPSPHKI